MTVGRRFGDWVLSYRNGYGERPGTGESGPVVLRIADISSGKVDLSNPRRGSVSDKDSERYKLRAGDLLFIRVNGARTIVGRCCVVSSEVPTDTIFNDHLIRVRLAPGVDPDFARFCVSASPARAVIETAASTSAGQFTISQQVLDSIEVPDVPLVEQREISSRLKAQLAETEVALLGVQKQLHEIHWLRRQTLDAVFGGIEAWQPIGSVAKLQSGYAFKSSSFKQSGVRLLRNTNVLPGKVYWDDTVYLSAVDAARFRAYELVAGDVLISLDRPVISSGVKAARVSEVDVPALLLQRVGRFVLDANRLDADYLFAFLQTGHFIAEISGHEKSLGVPHISPAQVEAVEIPLPDVRVQRQLTQRLKQIDEAWSAAAAALERQRQDLQVLPQRLLAQAFER